MIRGRRVALVAAAALGAFATASSALGAYTPRFTVNHNPHSVASATTVIGIALTPEDDATAVVRFYAPLGYQGVLGQAPGTQVGTVAATVQATRLGPNIVLPLNGTVVTDDPARYVANPCAPGTHRAVWVLRLEAAGQTLMVPVYIDVPTGVEASFASFRFQVCLPSPHIPPEQGGAAFGAKLLTAQLSLQRGLVAAPTTAGRYVWPAFFTPYPNAPAPPNVAGTVQSRAVAQIPGQATISARYVRRGNRYQVSGAVTENGVGVGGATVEIFKGLRANRLSRIGRARTAANGRFSRSGRVTPRRRTYFRARAVVPNRVNSTVGCAIAVPNLPTVPGGCVSAVYSGFTVQSRIVSNNPR
jgi:hypothetical protein